MSWESLKSAVSAVITANGNSEITGQIFQDLINNNLIPQLGNNKYKGVALVGTAPGSPESEEFYIANTTGVFSNFGITITVPGVYLFSYDGNTWSYLQIFNRYAVDNKTEKGTYTGSTSDLEFDLSQILLGKLEKGGYTGTAQDLKNELDNAVFGGAKTYQTKAEQDADLPIPSENTPSKIANDPNLLLNGSWAVTSGTWVQNDSVVSQIVDSEDIKTSGNSLLMNDRPKSLLNSLGYHRLRAGFDWGNVPANYANCRIEIVRDFDLGGATIALPSNVTLVPKGGVLKNYTEIVCDNTSIEANLSQVFDGSGIVSGTFNIDNIYPQWFGAKGNGVNDDSPAFQKAVDFVELIGSALRIPLTSGQVYSLHSTVIIKKGIYISGGIGAINWFSMPQAGYIKCGGTNTVMFDYGDSGVYSTSSFSINGLNFKDPLNTKTHIAINHTQSNNGPHRGFTMVKCSGFGLDVGVNFSPVGNILSAANVTVQDCNFNTSNDILRATDNPLARVLGLRFVGNQSEQGSRINGRFDSQVVITDNMLEGQSDPITLTGASGIIEIDRNYGEACNGSHFASLTSTNSVDSLFRLGNIYNMGPAKDIYKINSVANVDYVGSSRTDAYITFMNFAGTLSTSSNLRGGGYKAEASIGARVLTSLKANQYLGSLGVENVSVKNDSSIGTDPMFLPHGLGQGRLITSGNYTANFNPGTTGGKTLVVGFMCRYKDVGVDPGTALLQVFGPSFSPSIGSFNIALPVQKGEWVIHTFSIGDVQSAYSNINFRIYPYGTSGSGLGCEIGGIFFYESDVTDERSVVYPIYPFK
tara:strand:+ start:6085 stop:8517 length:2433 start_codon:yes stop_codon:yes gene_type:complete